MRQLLKNEAGRITKPLLADRKEALLHLAPAMRAFAQEETPGEAPAIPEAFRAICIRRRNSTPSSGGLRSEIRRQVLRWEHLPYIDMVVASRLTVAQALVRAADPSRPPSRKCPDGLSTRLSCPASLRSG